MGIFLNQLKDMLSDKRYGWYEEPKITFPTPDICAHMMFIQNISTKGQASVYPMPSPPQPVGYYGNEDCQKQWWDREKKGY